MEDRELFISAQRGEREAKEQLFNKNTGLIHHVVKRFVGRGGIEPEDLFQIGAMGLIKAIEKFDTDYEVQFSTYAVPLIMGEIRRFLRDDGPVKVSRGLKERGISVRGARSRLAAELGREPTLSELAADTGLAPEDIAVAETAVEPVLSLQTETGESGLTLEGLLSAGDEEELVVEKLALRGALARLPEREQQVMLLRYYRVMTQAQTARVVGVSQVQVSRLERRALEWLRAELNG